MKFSVSFFLFIFFPLGIESRVPCMLSIHSTTELYPAQFSVSQEDHYMPH
jgi:hypothetical protein